MVRFKDVTKVVLVLALCFSFAGVSSATTCSEAEDLCAKVTDMCDKGKSVEEGHKECERNNLFCLIDPVGRNNNTIVTNYYCGKVDAVCSETDKVCTDESHKRISKSVADYKCERTGGCERVFATSNVRFITGTMKSIVTTNGTVSSNK